VVLGNQKAMFLLSGLWTTVSMLQAADSGFGSEGQGELDSRGLAVLVRYASILDVRAGELLPLETCRCDLELLGKKCG
jgi:hypothetical protein